MSLAGRFFAGSGGAPPPFLSYAFRPMFLVASLWAALAIVLWVVVLLSGRVPPSRFNALDWHIHAMLFGFVPAAVAGFLLTAVATWTGRGPVRGATLAALALLWFAGRVVSLWSAEMPLAVAAAVDVAFCVAVAALAAGQILLARNWRNLPIPVPLLVLAAGNALMYVEAGGGHVAPGLGWRLGLAAIIAMISVIGGRIIPAFTQNWLSRTARAPVQLPARRPLDTLSLASLQLGLLGWAFWPDSRIAGGLLILGALLTLLRLLRWRGRQTLAEPLLAILHAGYAWMSIGALLLGVSIFTGKVPLPAAIHALTVGTIGTMILAVMTRVALGHTGRPLHAGPTAVVIYLLVGAAAILRMAAAVAAASAYLSLILAAAAMWVAAFVLFAADFAPILVAPRLQPRTEAAAAHAIQSPPGGARGPP